MRRRAVQLEGLVDRLEQVDWYDPVFCNCCCKRNPNLLSTAGSCPRAILAVVKVRSAGVGRTSRTSALLQSPESRPSPVRRELGRWRRIGVSGSGGRKPLLLWRSVPFAET
jgi:hypothetical protein